MAWDIEFAPAAHRELEKLDKSVSDRILRFLHERVAKLDAPSAKSSEGLFASSGNIELAITA